MMFANSFWPLQVVWQKNSLKYLNFKLSIFSSSFLWSCSILLSCSFLWTSFSYTRFLFPNDRHTTIINISIESLNSLNPNLFREAPFGIASIMTIRFFTAKDI
ncbi:hypothetical protein ACB098_11G123300 [Castanea mollissima]